MTSLPGRSALEETIEHGTSRPIDANEQSFPPSAPKPKSRTCWLLATAGLLLLTGLGASDLWTQEDRWGNICQEMLRSGDYVHPLNINRPYYDKPLLSYWLMLGAARILGALDGWALRLPSALCGVLAVWCTYRTGRRLLSAEAGLLAGLMLSTTFYFIDSLE